MRRYNPALIVVRYLGPLCLALVGAILALKGLANLAAEDCGTPDCPGLRDSGKLFILAGGACLFLAAAIAVVDDLRRR